MAAIYEALNAVKVALETAGITVEIDRQEDEMLAESEQNDVVSLNWGGAELLEIDNCDSYFWDATIILDCWACVQTGDTLSVLQKADALLADVAAALRVDRTFGNKFMRSGVVSVSDLASLTADKGSVQITLNAKYQTAKGDWTTISS